MEKAKKKKLTSSIIAVALCVLLLFNDNLWYGRA